MGRLSAELLTQVRSDMLGSFCNIGGLCDLKFEDVAKVILFLTTSILDLSLDFSISCLTPPVQHIHYTCIKKTEY